MPNIQRPMTFHCPRISQIIVQAGYKPHLQAKDRHKILEELVHLDRYGAKGIWYKLDQIVLNNLNTKVGKIITRDRNWIRKHFLPFRWDYASEYLFPMPM